MPINIVWIENRRKDIKSFVTFAEKIYPPSSLWTPPLISEQTRFIRKGPFNRIGEKQLLMAFRDGRPVARLSVHRNFVHNAVHGVNQGVFGFFETMDDAEAVEALFEAGGLWLRERGCAEVIGPMNFSVYGDTGILVEGFDEPSPILCPYHPPYYAERLEAIGFRREIDWYGYCFDAPPRFSPAIERLHGRIMSSPHTRLRALRLETWDADAEVIRRIFNEAWVENWGHVPMEKEEWTYQADQLKQVILRDLSWIVEVDGHPAGFMIVVKDLSAALKQARGRLFPTGLLRLLWRSRNIDRARILIMGLLKPYQGQGYDLVMAIESLKRGTKAGYVFCDCSQIAESNHRITGNLERLGARRYKTFRLYRKTLA